MCGTAGSLVLTQYVWYGGQFNADTICAVQRAVWCWHNMYGTAGSLVLTQYVWYSGQFNADTICVVQRTV